MQRFFICTCFLGLHSLWLTLLLFAAHSKFKYCLCLEAFFFCLCQNLLFVLCLYLFVNLHPFYTRSCFRPLRCASHLYCVWPFVSHWKHAGLSCWRWQVNNSFKIKQTKKHPKHLCARAELSRTTVEVRIVGESREGSLSSPSPCHCLAHPTVRSQSRWTKTTKERTISHSTAVCAAAGSERWDQRMSSLELVNSGQEWQRGTGDVGSTWCPCDSQSPDLPPTVPDRCV